jgi:Mycothiol maleylpyruvate isomerase N-terminal domain
MASVMPESIAMPQPRAALLPRIQQERAALEETISQLTAAEMTKPGPNGGWSVKDHLAHLAIWEKGVAALLEGRPRYAAMGFEEATYLHTDLDGLNAIIHEHYRLPHRRMIALAESGRGCGRLGTWRPYVPAGSAPARLGRSA